MTMSTCTVYRLTFITLSLLSVHTCELSQNFPDSLLLFNGDTGVVTSWLETLDKSKMRFGLTKNKRRRVVSDSDCDDAEGKVDSIENVCDTYRYSELTKLTPQFQEMMQRNSSLDYGMVNINTQLNGDVLGIGDSRGLLKTLLMQRVALYGGVSPETNMTEMGLLKRFELLLHQSYRISNSETASLDSMWAATKQVDKRIGNRLYDQVFKYATLVDEMLVNLQASSASIVKTKLAAIADLANSNNVQLMRLTAEICNEQTQVVKEARLAGSDADSAIPVMSKTIDILVDKSNELLDAFDDLEDKGTDAMKIATDKSNQVLSDGIDSLDSIAQRYVLTFAASVSRLIETFGAMLATDSGALVHPVTWGIGNFSIELGNLTSNESQRIETTQETILDRLAAVKLDLESRITAAQQKQVIALASAEDTVTAAKDKIAADANTLASSQKELGMSYSGAQADLAGSMNTLRENLNGVLDSASTTSRQKLGALTKQVDNVQSQIGGLISSASVNRQVQSAQESLWGGTQDGKSIVGAQLAVLRNSGATSESKTRLLADSSSFTIQSGLGPLKNAALNMANSAYATVGGINAARQTALTDLSASIQADDAATAARRTALAASTHAVFANSPLAGTIRSDSSSLQSVQSTLANAHVPIQGLASLQAAGAATEQLGARGMAHVAESLDKANSDISLLFQSSASKIVHRGKASANQVLAAMGDKMAKADISVSLEQLIDQLKTGDLVITSGSAVEKQIMNLASAAAAAVAASGAKADKTKKKFQADLHRFAQGIASWVPKLAATNAQELAQIEKSAQDQLVQVVGETYASTRAKLNQILAAAKSLHVTSSIDGGWAETANTLNAQLADAKAQASKLQLDSEKRIASFKSAERGFNKTLALTERNLTATIQKMGSEYVSEMAASADSMGTASAAIITSFNAAREARLTAVGAATDTGAAALPGTIVLGDIDGVDLTSQLAEQRVGITANQTRNMDEVAALSDEVEALSGSIDSLQAKDSAQAIASQAAIASAVDTANKLKAQATLAGSAQGNALLMFGSQSNAQSQFVANAAAVQATRLAQGLGVDEVSIAVEDYGSSMHTVVDSVATEPAHMQDALTSTQRAIALQLKSVRDRVEAQDAAVRGNLSMEAQIELLQLEEVKRFASSVGGAWNDYEAYEAEKFSKMDNEDRVSLGYLKKIVDSGHAKGTEDISSARTKLSETSADLDSRITELDRYQSEFDREAAALQATLAAERPSVSDLALSSTAESQEAIDNEKVSEFEKGLDEILAQVQGG